MYNLRSPVNISDKLTNLPPNLHLEIYFALKTLKIIMFPTLHFDESGSDICFTSMQDFSAGAKSLSSFLLFMGWALRSSNVSLT
jgi:hypothetical protein